MEAWKKRLPIVSMTPFSLQDYPGHSSCILWFTGCQMRCPYCHNPNMAKGLGAKLDLGKVMRFLRARVPYLDGVTLSGGEYLLSPDVVPFVRGLRELKYLVKVDTNGGSPSRLEALLAEGLLDYVAMDFKAPMDLYRTKVGWGDTDKWERCFRLLQRSGIVFELRTTVHVDLLNEAEVERMFDFLEARGFRGVLYLQHFQTAETLGSLAKPSRRFDLRRLNLNRSFEVEYRNFTADEIRQSIETFA